jgi:hypothetical protein
LYVDEKSQIQGTTGKTNADSGAGGSDVQRPRNMLSRGRRSGWDDTGDLLARAGMEVLVLEKQAHHLRGFTLTITGRSSIRCCLPVGLSGVSSSGDTDERNRVG